MTIKKLLSQKTGELALTLTVIAGIMMMAGLTAGVAVVKNQMTSTSLANQNAANPFRNFSAVSGSKLGIFILSNNSAGAQKIITAGPKVIKVMDPQNISSLLGAAKTYKTQFPGGKSILRIYDNTQGLMYDINQDPNASAQDFFNRVIQPALAKLGTDKQYFDYIETPNEADNTTDWDTVANMQWLSKFWMKLATLNKNSGMGTCAGSISVGGVGGSSDQEIGQRIAEFVPLLRQLKSQNGAWCYHAYTLMYSTDPTVEQWYSLRYRKFYAYLSANAPDVADIPMILSEAGVDAVNGGNKQTSGWQARGTMDQYKNWLTWFDGQMKNDNYILGSTIFEIGDTSWSSFNIEPIADWLFTYLGGVPNPTTPGPSPTAGGPTPPLPTGSNTTPPLPSLPPNPNGNPEIRFAPVSPSGGGTLIIGSNSNTPFNNVYLQGQDQSGNLINFAQNNPNIPIVCTNQQCTGGNFNANVSTNKKYLWIYSAANIPPGTYNFTFYANCTGTLGRGCQAQSTNTVTVTASSAGPTPTGLPLSPTVTPGATGSPSPTGPAGSASGYTNKDYEIVITQYGAEQISPLTVSAWLSLATRVPGLQTATCYPPNCDFAQ